jgi:membrane protease YdiL (CAAX protease family)
MVVASAVLFAPVYEELLFRGHLQTLLVYSLLKLLKPSHVAAERPGAAVRWVAIFITSIFFTMVHRELWMMPPIFLLSICLGYAYERTGNLWVPMLLHAAFNAANVMLFLFRSQQ